MQTVRCVEEKLYSFLTTALEGVIGRHKTLAPFNAD